MAVINVSTPVSLLVERLQKHRFFRDVDIERLYALAREAICYTFDAGETIFSESHPCAGLWVIGEGSVKVLRVSAEGREHILRLLGPGDSFNDIAALDGGPNAATAITLTEVTCCMISHETLRAHILADPQFALVLIGVLTARTRMLVQQVEDLALYSVTVRLARFLLKQAENPALNKPCITRAAIAAHLAAKPETISRSLRELERVGIITHDRHTIHITDQMLLRAVALL